MWFPPPKTLRAESYCPARTFQQAAGTEQSIPTPLAGEIAPYGRMPPITKLKVML